MRKIFGFTLAEVLITLGIIGVVAALTIPALVTKHQKHVTETRLKKFYANINQAVKLSEVDNGAVDNWQIPNDMTSLIDFYSKYLAKYLNCVDDLKVIPIGVTGDSYVPGYTIDVAVVKFADGSAMTMAYSDGIDIGFYPYAAKINSSNNKPGKDNFAFTFFKKTELYSKKNFIEPFTHEWNGTNEHLISHIRYGCNKTSVSKGYCAKLIQMNGWKIPQNYPW